MLSAITPVENAFELIGLDRSRAIIEFLFLQSAFGKSLFGLGFILALWRSVHAGSIRPFMMFCTIFFIIWMLFVLPSREVDGYPSVMEERGFREISTTSLLEKQGFGKLTVNPVFLTTVQLLNSLSNNLINVMEVHNVTGEGFLKSPFLPINLSVLVARLFSQGITDSGLKQEVTAFYYEVYLPVLKKLASENDSLVPSGLWPGDSRVVARYSAQDGRRWGQLQESLYKYLDDKNHLLEKAHSLFGLQSPVAELSVRDFLLLETERRPEDYGVFSCPDMFCQSGGISAYKLSDKFFVAARMVLRGWPYVLGGMLAGWYVFFPVFLLAVMVKGKADILSGYFCGLLVLKLCPFCLTVLDSCSRVILLRSDPQGFRESAGVAVGVSAGIVVILVCVLVSAFWALAGAKMIFQPTVKGAV